MADTFYAWSDLYYGGETEMRTRADGRSYRVVLSRNFKARGEKVTQKELDLGKDEWEALVESGSVRSYPLPEEADDYLSPTQAIIDRLFKEGEIDPNMLLELSLAHPLVPSPPSPGAEDEKVPAGA